MEGNLAILEFWLGFQEKAHFKCRSVCVAGLGAELNLVGECEDVMLHNMREEHCLQFQNQTNSSTDTGDLCRLLVQWLLLYAMQGK